MKKIINIILMCAICLSIFSFGNTASAANANSAAGIVSTASSRLNVRSQASTSSSVVTTLSKGSYVTLISQSGNWWYIEYANGRYGYCHTSYITKTSGTAAYVNTSSSALNVRSGAGTSNTIVGSVAKGKYVVILSQTNGWSKIVYNGTKIGYASSAYLKASASTGSILLSIPNYKQKDSRWANVYIGNSGKTIGKIGCTTTAIAMMESYRQGKTIYPDAMSKNLSYDSSGNLYWPSNYVQTTNASGYLNKIYSLLQQGKPVLIGAKSASGGQHWVVVTGFTGGSTQNTASYRINDPGSNSRATLQQFLNEYPVFYKLIHY